MYVHIVQIHINMWTVISKIVGSATVNMLARVLHFSASLHVYTVLVYDTIVWVIFTGAKFRENK